MHPIALGSDEADLLNIDNGALAISRIRLAYKSSGELIRCESGLNLDEIKMIHWY